MPLKRVSFSAGTVPSIKCHGCLGRFTLTPSACKPFLQAFKRRAFATASERPAKARLQAPGAVRRRRAVLHLKGRSPCRRGQHARELHALLLPLHVPDLSQPPGGSLTARTHQRSNCRRLTRPGTSSQDQAQGLRVTPPQNGILFWAKPLIAQPCFFTDEVVREAGPRIQLIPGQSVASRGRASFAPSRPHASETRIVLRRYGTLHKMPRVPGPIHADAVGVQATARRAKRHVCGCRR